MSRLRDRPGITVAAVRRRRVDFEQHCWISRQWHPASINICFWTIPSYTSSYIGSRIGSSSLSVESTSPTHGWDGHLARHLRTGTMPVLLCAFDVCAHSEEYRGDHRH